MYGQQWTIEETKLLGTAPDSEVAELLDRTKRSVAVKRRSLGIASFVPPRLPWSEEEDNVLGSVADSLAGQVVGRSRQGTKKRRVRKGIVAHRYK